MRQDLPIRETDKGKRSKHQESLGASLPTQGGESAKHTLAHGEEWVCSMLTSPDALQEVLFKATADGVLAIAALAGGTRGVS